MAEEEHSLAIDGLSYSQVVGLPPDTIANPGMPDSMQVDMGSVMAVAAVIRGSVIPDDVVTHVVANSVAPDVAQQLVSNWNDGIVDSPDVIKSMASDITIPNLILILAQTDIEFRNKQKEFQLFTLASSVATMNTIEDLNQGGL